jgi:hypothetical protein
MQVQQVSATVTWATFAIEAVKILGPATLALLGSAIALRYQRKLKEIEIDAATKLKARELMFGGYESRSKRQVGELQELAKAVSQLTYKIKLGTQEEQKEALLGVAASLAGATSKVMFSLDQIEAELERFELSNAYRADIDSVKECINDETEMKNLDDAKRVFGGFFKSISKLAHIQEELIERKRERLFEEYLPK